MAGFGTLVRSILRGILPSAVYSGLKTLRNEALVPKSALHRSIGRFASSKLSPSQYIALRKAYLKTAGSLNLTKFLARFERDRRAEFLTIVSEGKSYATLEALLNDRPQSKNAAVVCCAFLGRHDVLDIVIDEAVGADQKHSVLVCLVGSSSEDEDYLKAKTANEPNVIGAIVKNNPVGLKWQSAVELARAVSDFEILAITGSDDVLPSRLTQRVVERHRQNLDNAAESKLIPALYGTIEWVLLAKGEAQDPVPQIVKCNYTLESCVMPLGAGRFYSRSFVDLIEGRLFDQKRNNLLDDRGFEMVNRLGLGVEYFDVHHGCVCSIKGDWSQLNNWDTIVNAPTVRAREFSFEGSRLLKDQLQSDTFARLFAVQCPPL